MNTSTNAALTLAVDDTLRLPYQDDDTEEITRVDLRAVGEDDEEQTRLYFVDPDVTVEI
jgi:hypothetical protein